MADGSAFCTRCGARLGPAARFCVQCGAEAAAASPGAPVGPPPGPPARRRSNPILLFVATAAVIAVIAVIALVVSGGSDDEPSGAPSVSPPVTAFPVPRTTAIPPSASGPPATVSSTTTTSVARRYVGLERDQGAMPAAVTEIGGSFLIPDYGIAWVEGPEGSMFWLERVAGTGPDGSVTRWRVVDTVTFPPLERDVSDVVVLGLTQCEIDGRATNEVVGIFASSGQEWLGPPRAAWRVDLTTGRLVPITSSVRCIDEGFGV